MGYKTNTEFEDWWDYVFEPEKYVVYAMYDISGTCLYVGRTSLHSLRHRFATHYNLRAWVREEVDRVEILSQHSTRGACQEAETLAIIEYMPEYNVAFVRA